MVKMVVGVLLLVFFALLVVLGTGLLLLYAVGFAWVFLENRRLVRALARCPCPHCGATLGVQSAKQAFRAWDKTPDGVQWTKCDRNDPDDQGLDIIIHVQSAPDWAVNCERCGQTSLFDVRDLLVYRSRHIGNDKLHAIADVMSEKDLEHSPAAERLDAICHASGCDRIDVLWVVNNLRRSTRESDAMGARSQ